MRTMYVSNKTLCLTLKGYKWGYLVSQRERLEPSVLPWRQHSWCHFVSSMTYISVAKFEEHCSNISGHIFDSVFNCLSETIYGVITFLICIVQSREYL